MTNSVPSKVLGLLAGASGMALVAGPAHARPVLAEVHGYMDHGKLVAVKVVEHHLAGTRAKKPPTYTYDFTYTYSTATSTGKLLFPPVDVTALNTATYVVGWGLYDNTTCTGSAVGKIKKPTAKTTLGKWSTDITPVTGATTSACPGGITGFSTANLLFSFTSKKAVTGSTVKGSDTWTAKLAGQECIDPSTGGTVACSVVFNVINQNTVVYEP